MIDHETAKSNLRKWVQSQWFTPNDFREARRSGKFNGLYMPHWTFDALTFNEYRGERGENYTVKDSQRKYQTKTAGIRQAEDSKDFLMTCWSARFVMQNGS